MTVYLEDVLYGKGKNFKSSKRGKKIEDVKKKSKSKNKNDDTKNIVDKVNDIESKKASTKMTFVPNVIKKNDDELKINI